MDFQLKGIILTHTLKSYKFTPIESVNELKVMMKFYGGYKDEGQEKKVSGPVQEWSCPSANFLLGAWSIPSSYLPGWTSPCCCGKCSDKTGWGYSRCLVGTAPSVGLFGSGGREGWKGVRTYQKLGWWPFRPEGWCKRGHLENRARDEAAQSRRDWKPLV